MSRQEASYPSELRRRRVGGTVVVQATVSEDGVPAAARVLRSADVYLDELALEAFRSWRYRPATCDGAPIDVYVTASFTFSLK